MKWPTRQIRIGDEIHEATSPLIISASRATDIPAFFSEWFFDKIDIGYLTWTNPFNRQEKVISLHDLRFIVFWSKDPKRIIPFLRKLDQKDIKYYFQFTLNDYEAEGIEKNVPPLNERILTFQCLSNLIGREKVIWRYDPLLLSDRLKMNELLSRVKRIGDRINNYTEKLVFSFADIAVYAKVQRNLDKTSENFREFSETEIAEFCQSLMNYNKKWNLKLSTCSEAIDLNRYGITKNRCIDDELIVKIAGNDAVLMNWLGYAHEEDLFSETDYKSNPKFKDTGQRKECGCIFSKDIGMYNTCTHLCTYCYANHNEQKVLSNFNRHNVKSTSII